MDLVFDTFNWMEYVIDLYQQPSCKLVKRIEQDFKALKKTIVVAYLFVWDIHALNSPSRGGVTKNYTLDLHFSSQLWPHWAYKPLMNAQMVWMKTE